MIPRLATVCVAFALAFTSTTLRAQVCAGYAGLRSGPLQFEAGAAFNSDASALGGSVTTGRELFGTVSIATTHIDAFNASSLSAAVGGGYDFAIESSRRIFLCPSASIQASFGPNDILGTGVDRDTKGFSFGFDVGGIAIRTPRFQLMPTAGLGVIYTLVTFKDATGSSPGSDTYGVVGAGVGFVIGRAFTIRPSVFAPFGLEESNVTFSLSFAINVGQGRSAE